jgi:ATP synthase protein I
VAKRMAGAAVRAELGKIAIMLVLFWLTFAEVPQMRESMTAMVLFLAFMSAQIAGWVQVARLDARLGTKHYGQED